MTKKCSKCETPFNCQNESRGCWCENLQVSLQQLAHLKEKAALFFLVVANNQTLC